MRSWYTGRVKRVPEKQKNTKPVSTIVKVRVAAGARRELVVQKEKGIAISVKEPAQENRANARVRELLAKKFGVPLKAVVLLRGHHAPSKTFSIRKI